MKPSVLLFAVVVVLTTVSAYAGTPAQAPTMRYKLDEGQVLVYQAVADTKGEGSGMGGGLGRHDGNWVGKSEGHVELVFSITAGAPQANGSTPITIEILDVKARLTRDTAHGTQTIEADAQGVKIYEGRKLVQQGKWGEVQLPSGLDLRLLLEAKIEAVVDQYGRIGGFDEPDQVKQLLQGANFLHLLVHQPIFPEGPITKGGSWKVERALVFANPLRLHELVTLPGTETHTAVEAVSQLNRNCLKIHIKGNWPKLRLENDAGEARADSSGTAVVDFATGVMFSSTAKTRQTLEGTVHDANARFEIESESTVTYVGDKQLYDKYKAK